MNDLDIRRLTYADLPQVIAIERRAFPTPWSLAMFVLELSKPSGICLAALIEALALGPAHVALVCRRCSTVCGPPAPAVGCVARTRTRPRRNRRARGGDRMRPFERWSYAPARRKPGSRQPEQYALEKGRLQICRGER